MTEAELTDFETYVSPLEQGASILKLVAEVRRLRALVRDIPDATSSLIGRRLGCIFCGRNERYGVKHAPNCPAFTEDGEVK